MTAVRTAAAAAGLVVDWEDANGVAHRVSDEVLAAILAVLDTDTGDGRFVTADQHAPITLPATAPAGPARLILEDGTERDVVIDAAHRIAAIETAGYHRLRAGAGEWQLAVAPPRCFTLPAGRYWGPAVQIPGLRGSRPSAYGDLGTLAEAARAFAAAGADALAISPTHALFPADPTRLSPYSPSTRLFHHALLADPTLVGSSPSTPAGPALIDWPAALPERLAQLRAAFSALPEDAQADLAAYRRDRGAALEAHARFDALHAHFLTATGASGWQDWPTAFHDCAGDAVARFATEHAGDVAFYAFLQWLAERSLDAAQAAATGAGMNIGLIADLAVGMDGGGSHAWSRGSDLLSGLSIGAPPDPLGPQGQNWGITALSPFALQRTGFAPFIETLRTALAHAGGLRIDHALGLKRLWVIPDGGSAADGAYLAMPFADMLRLIALESHRAQAVIIAEDLGTVTPGFRDTLAERSMLGMKVLPFERQDDVFIASRDWGRDAAAMTGTHDTATVAGWWRGRDLEWAAALGRTDPDADLAEVGVHRDEERAAMWQAFTDAGVAGGPVPAEPAPAVDAALRFVADSPCPLVIVPIEDLLGLEEQPNLPGTTTEHPNWRRRMPDTTVALLARPDVSRRTALLTKATA
nr:MULTISPECIES: 4-alpha-glucanotransferase [unclassified Sphingomonas]